MISRFIYIFSMGLLLALALASKSFAEGAALTEDASTTYMQFLDAARKQDLAAIEGLMPSDYIAKSKAELKENYEDIIKMTFMMLPASLKTVYHEAYPTQVFILSEGSSPLATGRILGYMEMRLAPDATWKVHQYMFDQVSEEHTLSNLKFRIEESRLAIPPKTPEPTTETADTQTEIRKTFYDNDQVKTEIPYVDGKKHGMARAFYPDGALKAEMKYKDDLTHGVFKQFDKEGNITHTSIYIRGNRMKAKTPKTTASLPIEPAPSEPEPVACADEHAIEIAGRITQQLIDRNLEGFVAACDLNCSSSAYDFYQNKFADVTGKTFSRTGAMPEGLRFVTFTLEDTHQNFTVYFKSEAPDCQVNNFSLSGA